MAQRERERNRNPTSNPAHGVSANRVDILQLEYHQLSVSRHPPPSINAPCPLRGTCHLQVRHLGPGRHSRSRSLTESSRKRERTKQKHITVKGEKTYIKVYRVNNSVQVHPHNNNFTSHNKAICSMMHEFTNSQRSCILKMQCMRAQIRSYSFQKVIGSTWHRPIH